MKKKVFLDINIIIDFLDEQRLGHNNAIRLLSDLLNNNSTIVISEDMLSTIAYIVKSQLRPQAIEFFKQILASPNFIIANFGSAVINMACDYFINNGGDFEDYLQYFCAEKENCDAIYTSDKNFPKLKIPIFSC